MAAVIGALALSKFESNRVTEDMVGGVKIGNAGFVSFFTLTYLGNEFMQKVAGASATNKVLVAFLLAVGVTLHRVAGSVPAGKGSTTTKLAMRTAAVTAEFLAWVRLFQSAFTLPGHSQADSIDIITNGSFAILFSMFAVANAAWLYYKNQPTNTASAPQLEDNGATAPLLSDAERAAETPSSTAPEDAAAEAATGVQQLSFPRKLLGMVRLSLTDEYHRSWATLITELVLPALTLIAMTSDLALNEDSKVTTEVSAFVGFAFGLHVLSFLGYGLAQFVAIGRAHDNATLSAATEGGRQSSTLVRNLLGGRSDAKVSADLVREAGVAANS